MHKNVKGSYHKDKCKPASPLRHQRLPPLPMVCWMGKDGGHEPWQSEAVSKVNDGEGERLQIRVEAVPTFPFTFLKLCSGVVHHE